MDDLFTLQDLVSTEIGSETTLILKIAAIIALLVKMEIKSLGRFYRMKLGIKE